MLQGTTMSGLAGVRRVGTRAGVPGWVYRVGGGGVYRYTTQLLGERSDDSEAGPGGPAGAGVGGHLSSGERGGGHGQDHPSGPVGLALPALPVLPSEMPPLGQYGENSLYFL